MQYTVEQNEIKSIVIDSVGEHVINLVGPGAEVHVSGVFQTIDKEDKAIVVIIHHQAPHTRATTTLKGVADDYSRISFTGRIIINKNCGDTNSFLTERILLLSDHAKAEAVPDLEIMTDDVKCSHAASISRIPEEHLFYLMSRGLNREAAEQLIVEGFLTL